MTFSFCFSIYKGVKWTRWSPATPEDWVKTNSQHQARRAGNALRKYQGAQTNKRTTQKEKRKVEWSRPLSTNAPPPQVIVHRSFPRREPSESQDRFYSVITSNLPWLEMTGPHLPRRRRIKVLVPNLSHSAVCLIIAGVLYNLSPGNLDEV